MNFTSQQLALEKWIYMKVEFNNEWYRDVCKENGFNPDNPVSITAVDLAKDCAIAMKKYMDAKNNYDDEKLQIKLDKQIQRLNEERIGYMLDALWYAEVVAGLGKGAEKFIRRRTQNM